MGTEFLFIIPPIIIFGGDILDAIHGAMARRAVHYIRMVVVPRWYLDCCSLEYYYCGLV